MRAADAADQSVLLKPSGYGLTRYTRKGSFSQFCRIRNLSCRKHTGTTPNIVGTKLSRTTGSRSNVVEITGFLPIGEDTGDGSAIHAYLASNVGIGLARFAQLDNPGDFGGGSVAHIVEV